MRSIVLSALLASALVAGSPDARAADDPPKPTRYYGWQNIIVGYTGLSLIAHGFASDSNALMLTGAAAWAFGGTVIHSLHGNSGAAAATPFITAGATMALVAASATGRDAEGLALLAAGYALFSPILDGALGRDSDPNRDVPIFTRVGLGIGRFRARQPAASSGVLAANSQFGLPIELSVGGHVRSVVIAGTLLEHIIAFDRAWAPTTPTGGELSFTLATLGPTVEWHPQRRGGPFVGGTAGLAHFARHTRDAPTGYAVAAQGGYDFTVGPRSSIGLLVRLLYASMRTTDFGGSRVQVFSPTLTLNYSYR